ncbi:MAG: CAAD domain-containing protein [Aulosira sp. DedQUE10]|nr:CAAD domain-containing protein [Aulosira sp. DedQUE10]
METQEQPVEFTNSTSREGTMALTGADTQNLPKLPPAKNSDAEWQRIANNVSDFLEKLPAYLGGFYQQYQQPLLTIIFILSAIVTLKVVLAILAAINSIPLLSSTFELIGIGYTGWLTFRYLLKATTRQELVEEIREFKAQIVGK